MKATRLHNRACDAFKREHGYLADVSSIEHQKWLHGWKLGYAAGRRHARRLQTTSGEHHG